MKEYLAKNKARNYLIILAVALVAAAFVLTAPHSNNKSQSTTILTSNEITPGAFPVASCPVHFYQSNSVIENVSGFSTHDFSNAIDYVLTPGSNGKISYKVHIGASQGNSNMSAHNITNWAQFSSTTSQGTEQDTHQGINVSITPISETFAWNSSYEVTISMNISAEAAPGTYWVSLSPGFCFGGPSFLLTVGNAPYNGSTTYVPVPA